MKNNKIWMDIITKVTAGEKNIISPFASDGIIQSIFVIVQKDTKMGWGRIWCSKTLRGIHLSRMQVPDTVTSIFSDEIEKLGTLPQIKIESF